MKKELSISYFKLVQSSLQIKLDPYNQIYDNINQVWLTWAAMATTLIITFWSNWNFNEKYYHYSWQKFDLITMKYNTYQGTAVMVWDNVNAIRLFIYIDCHTLKHVQLETDIPCTLNF